MITTSIDSPHDLGAIVVVHVVADDGYPRIARGCPTCNRRQPFACTGKFRVNANGKLLDIWLLYRCAKCEFAFNLPIIERTSVDRVDSTLLNAAVRNDRYMAGRYARDVGLLKRNKIKLDSGDEWRLTSTASELLNSDGNHLLRLKFDTPLIVRLRHVLAEALAVSRSRVAALERSGAIRQVTPGNAKLLRVWNSCDVAVSGRPADREDDAPSNE